MITGYPRFDKAASVGPIHHLGEQDALPAASLSLDEHRFGAFVGVGLTQEPLGARCRADYGRAGRSEKHRRPRLIPHRRSGTRARRSIDVGGRYSEVDVGHTTP